MTLLYFIIFMLVITNIIWIINSTKQFNDIKTRTLFCGIGIAFIGLITLIVFAFSKIGVSYPKKEMVGQVRRIMMWIFIPINSFIMLPQVANLITRMKNDDTPKEKLAKITRRILLIFAFVIIIECVYFKNIQMDIIKNIDMYDKNNSVKVIE